MAEQPNVLETLRRARPDIPSELVSPHDPVAQALIEEILSMPDTPARRGGPGARDAGPLP